MRPKEIMATDNATIGPRESADPEGRRPSRAAAAQRFSFPTTLPRPVKLTRDRSYTCHRPRTFVCSALRWKTTIATILRENSA
jgi:hypothetical protein